MYGSTKFTPSERDFYNFFSELLVDFLGAEPYLPLIKQTYSEQQELLLLCFETADHASPLSV
jgi:hypothetical protein